MVQTKSMNETAEWEVIKPVPRQAGFRRPWLSVRADDVLLLNNTARRLLKMENGGYFDVVLDKKERRMYIVPREEASSTTFHATKAGKWKDMLLPAKLRVMYNLRSDICDRVYIDITPIRYDFDLAYRLSNDDE